MQSLKTVTPEIGNKVLVSCKDLPFVERGIELWPCVEGDCADSEYVLPGEVGQWISYIYDGDTYTTIDHTDIPNLTDEQIFIGQLESQYGKNYANGIRYIAGEYMTACDLVNIDVTGYSCPQPQIGYVGIDGCFECGDTISIRAKKHDNRIASWMDEEERGYEIYEASAPVECCQGCDDCPGEGGCQKPMMNLVDQLMGNIKTAGDNGIGYPGIKTVCPTEKTNVTWMVANCYFPVYCLAPTKEECSCDDCNSIAAITEVTIGGETVVLENTTNAAGDKTFLDQLDTIVDQINCKFKEILGPHSGTAFVSGGTDDCCPRQLMVNTCDEGFAIAGLEPCDVLKVDEPFTKKDKPGYKDCEGGGCVEAIVAENKVCCGIIWVADQDKFECDCPCGPSDPPPDTFLRFLKVELLKGDPTNCGIVSYGRELMEPKIPTGSGGIMRWEEANREAEGEWWNNDSEREGYHGDLRKDKYGRERNAATCAKCSSKYCRYEWRNKRSAMAEDGKTPQVCVYETIWGVDKDHPVAGEALELFFTALAESSATKCHVPKIGTCAEAIEECPPEEEKE